MPEAAQIIYTKIDEAPNLATHSYCRFFKLLLRDRYRTGKLGYFVNRKDYCEFSR
ncbi:MAG: hypothetical protein CM1200mP35_04560 [Chloroflexota bacterium]|nr:MAG: hypothetical protein CM1200mP35_04560 [Chloroflexota bacterium]